MIIDLASLSANARYFTLIQSLVPRPVAWVLSRNSDGGLNLAPFSYFSGVASDPPLLMLSVGKKPDGSRKDTRENILARNDFVVHIPHREQAHHVTASSASLAQNESELDLLDLTLTDFDGAALPRITECRIAMACEYHSHQDITPSQTMILGQIRTMYIADEVMTEVDGRRKIHADKIDPLARLGGNEYGTLGGIIDVPRPK